MSETKKTKSVLGDMAPSESSLPLARDLAWVCQEILWQLPCHSLLHFSS